MIYLFRLVFLLVFTVAVVEAALDVDPGRGLATFIAFVCAVFLIGLDDAVKELA